MSYHGSNSEIAIGTLVEKISELLGTKIEIISDANRVRPINSEVDRLCCDNSKISKFTSWKPNYNLEDGLDSTIKWLKEYHKNYKADIYNV